MEPHAQKQLQNPNPPFPSPSQPRVSLDGSIDVTISGWILEFLLRKIVEDPLINDFYPILSIPHKNARLKKTVLLRTIQYEISNGGISEKILEYFEHIGDIDNANGVAILESMKKAYCAVAVDSTIRVLKGKVHDRAKYFDAVVRIWRGKICKLEESGKIGLFSDELRKWKTHIEAAVVNTNACKFVLRRCIKINALQAVETYLKEAWEKMGPSFLEFVATQTMRTENAKGELHCISQDTVRYQIGEPMSGSLNANKDIAATDKDSSSTSKDVGINNNDKVSAQTMRTEKAKGEIHSISKDPVCDQIGETMSGSPNANKDIAATDKDSSSTSKDVGINNNDKEKAKGEIHSISKDPVCDQIGETMSGSLNANKDVAATNKDSSTASKDVGINNNDKEKQKRLSKRKHVEFGGRCSRRAVHAKSKGVKIHDTEELSKPIFHEKYDCVPTPEVCKARAALRSSSLDLQEVVKDPLPEAMRVAETLLGDMCVASADAPAHLVDAVGDAVQGNEGNSGNNCSEAAQANEGNPANLTSEPGRVNADNTGNECFGPQNIVPRPCLMEGNKGDPANHIPEPGRASEDDTGNQCFGPHNVVPRSSLMERNNTAHTYEWDNPDPVNVSPLRYYLPSPTTVNASPLKKIEIEKLARRRKNRRWSSLEEDTLRTAVQRYGKGNWKLILNSYPDIFGERTEVDLKDKWRNMIK